MKRFMTSLPILCLALGLVSQGEAADASRPLTGPVSTPEVIAQVHSVGTAQWGADPNGTVFKDIWSLPATVQLRRETLGKLALTAAARFQPKANQPPGKNPVALIQPLLDELCTSEVFADVVEHAQKRIEFTLAVRLDDIHMRLWQANLDQLAAGWNLKQARFTSRATNGWMIVHSLPQGADSAAAPAAASPLFRSFEQGRPPTAPAGSSWLHVTADLLRWSEYLGKAPGKDLPRIEMTVAGRKEYLRTQARLTFRGTPVSRLENWDTPVETIRDPLISFTAVRGVGNWLSRFPLIQELGLTTVPNQFFLWGLSQTSFQIQGAVPVSAESHAFERIAAKWMPEFNTTLSEYSVGSIQSLTNRAELIWHGLPIVVPYLQPKMDHGKTYLHGGIFPVAPATNPPPEALFRQLNAQTNLVYYDWEITQARLDELRPLLQLAAVFLTISPMSTNSSAYKWLDVVEPRLGNSITEVTATSPHELSLVRTSHLGLNGAELLTLANWLEGTNFPRSNLDVRFRPVLKSVSQPKKP